MSLDLPGFADPVADAQSSFRAVLDAMARPGSLHSAGARLTPPAPLDAATGAVLLTLIDGETPLWLAPEAEAAREWIGFHCGALFAARAADAAFALVLTEPDFTSLSSGTDERPEDSAMLILQVRALGHGTPFRLSGPGLKTPATLRVDGLPVGFTTIWAANHALFPGGIDLILCAGTTLAALPRSVQIEEG